MQSAHITVTGFVQGVGYRKFVRHEARSLHIVGWVRNLADGTVEALAVGEKEHLETLIEACKKGPFLSQVDNVHVEWDETEEKFEEFGIRHE